MDEYTLLIVDDETLTLDLLCNAIHWQDLNITHVFAAKNSNAAQNYFKNTKIDVMICDIEMPGGSGLELLRWVRTNSYSTETIFLTSHAEFKYAQEAIKLNCLNYLLKPVFFEELYQVVADALKHAALQRNPTGSAPQTEDLEKSTMEKIHAYIESHFAEDISCQSISRDFYISMEHLSRSFKKKYGISPSSYLQECRLREAKRLLATSSLNISDVSAHAGYSNYSYFSSIFKQATGMSPLGYRKAKSKEGLMKS